jgi:hypothetical protein
MSTFCPSLSKEHPIIRPAAKVKNDSLKSAENREVDKAKSDFRSRSIKNKCYLKLYLAWSEAPGKFLPYDETLRQQTYYLFVKNSF